MSAGRLVAVALVFDESACSEERKCVTASLKSAFISVMATSFDKDDDDDDAVAGFAVVPADKRKLGTVVEGALLLDGAIVVTVKVGFPLGERVGVTVGLPVMG